MGSTRHGPPRNALAHETSPYLLQHAGNPVDWHPWGEGAIAQARRRGVPIFLSIGYSTCYWCHVMERESFEDDETAALLNECFVNVKVDREERPDIDDIYMAATITLTGQGGWPMSVWLEPEGLRPFWAGTYYPKAPRHGLPSFAQVIRGMSDAYRDQRTDVLEQAARLASAVQEQLAERAQPVAVGEPSVARAAQRLLTMFDTTNGGFGGAPKFPQPQLVQLLLDVRDRAADDDTRTATEHAAIFTMDRMLIGGLHDHAGGGFHRYCVDATWTVPHFEKMLYDNAQLLALFARTGAAGDAEHARAARRTAAYLLREMTTPGGAFASAQDAEVNSREGQNYIWTREQAESALAHRPELFDLALRVYRLDATNFTDPHHPGDGPRTVLRFDKRPDELAVDLGIPPAELHARLDEINGALLGVRDQRDLPALDDKVIAAWNGMAIEALAEAGRLLGEPAWIEAADGATAHVLSAHDDGARGLVRTSRNGVAKAPGFLDDHAAMAGACLAQHRTGRDRLSDAARLVEAAIQRFGDGSGGFYDAPPAQDDLFVRPRSSHDGAVPSGVGSMLLVLVDLAILTREARWAEAAGACLRSVSASLKEYPVGSVVSARALLRMLGSRDLFAPFVDFDEREGVEDQPRGPAQPAVEVYADAERVSVSEGTPAVFSIVVRAPGGVTIVAGDAEAAEGPGLQPLRVGLITGQGVRVFADYPPGEAYGVEAAGEISVYRGEAEFRVMLERAEGIGAAPGRPILGITYQACTEGACLRPVTRELDVAVDLD